MDVVFFNQTIVKEAALWWSSISFPSVFSEAACRKAAVLRMSMTGSGASVLCTQNPQSYNICSSHRQREGDGTEESRRGCFHSWTERKREREKFTSIVCLCGFIDIKKSVCIVSVSWMNCEVFPSWVWAWCNCPCLLVNFQFHCIHPLTSSIEYTETPHLKADSYFFCYPPKYWLVSLTFPLPLWSSTQSEQTRDAFLDRSTTPVIHSPFIALD